MAYDAIHQRSKYRGCGMNVDSIKFIDPARLTIFYSIKYVENIYENNGRI